MKTCPQCHTVLPDDAPEGLCPRCLASAAFRSEPTVITGVSPDIADAEEVARRLPQYEILELLGRGGMGVVYKARQKQLDRIVALKILPPADALSPDFVERFRREAQSLAKLSHPNIVSVHDFGESGGLYYFAMEFVDGVNLRQMIRSKQMTAAEALAVVPKICDALQYAHDEGVVHRDIKPENILVDTRGRVKIADFGLAKLLRREDDLTLTLSGMSLGTPRYMAPEQVEKPETVDHRADIYSLGVVFYEMLTGELPMGRFDPPSQKVQVDVRLDEIVLHTLEKEPALRYQRADEVKTAVESVTGKPAARRVPEMPSSKTVRPPGAWTPLEIAAVATTLLAFLTGAVNALFDLAQNRSPMHGVTAAAIIAAAAFSAALMIAQQFRPSTRAALPGLHFTVLAACTGSLPWSWIFGDITGWNFWHGAAFAALNFVVALTLLSTVSAGIPRARAFVLVLTGLAGLVLILWWSAVPVTLIGDRGGFLGTGSGPMTINRKPALYGAWIGIALAILTAIAGALQLRFAATAPSVAGSPPLR